MKYSYPLPAFYAAHPDDSKRNGVDDLIHKAVRNYKSQLHMLSEEEVDAQVWYLSQFPIRFTVKCCVDAKANTIAITVTHEQTNAAPSEHGKFVKLPSGAIMFQRAVKPVVY